MRPSIGPPLCRETPASRTANVSFFSSLRISDKKKMKEKKFLSCGNSLKRFFHIFFSSFFLLIFSSFFSSFLIFSSSCFHIFSSSCFLIFFSSCFSSFFLHVFSSFFLSYFLIFFPCLFGYCSDAKQSKTNQFCRPQTKR